MSAIFLTLLASCGGTTENSEAGAGQAGASSGMSGSSGYTGGGGSGSNKGGAGAGGNGSGNGGKAGANNGGTDSQGGVGGEAGGGGLPGGGSGGKAGASGKAGAAGKAGGGGDCGALSTGEPACDGCLKAECCQQTAACSSNPDCLALLSCFSSCSADTCFQQCLNEHQAGVNDAQAVIDCLGNKCDASCGGGGSSGAGGAPGSCSHGVCSQGGPLLSSCSSCSSQVCNSDPYCCNQAWDSQCVAEADQICGAGCGTGAGGGPTGPCSSITCPKGCCNDAGECVTTGEDSACGLSGAACVDCAKLGSFCSYGSCAACTPECDGKACGEPDGCGKNCTGSCADGKVCVVGSKTLTDGCYACGPDSCPYGCCDEKGVCQYGHERDACGSGGAACKSCGAQACNSKTEYKQINGELVIVSTNSCGPCGSSCLFVSPDFPVCQSDGCGNLCPGAGCGQPPPGSSPSECQIKKDGSAQCMPQGFCDPFFCDGCCDYSGGFFGSCAPGNLPGKCGSSGVACVDCVSKGQSCDPDTGLCVGCLGSCDFSNSCGQANSCGGVCTGADGGQCPPGSTCDDKGKCTCGAGKSLCWDQATSKQSCLDTSSDPKNCGACNNVCPDGIACVDGKCDCPEGNLFCHAQGPDHPAVCTSVANDPDNCGYCGNVCPGTPCVHGACGTCAEGTTPCPFSDPPTCATTATDPKNCGACGNACPDGIACVNGECDCPGNKVSCNGACIDVQTDPKNCGGCYASCPNGVACVAGKCNCPSGTTYCGGQCTNPQVDPQNCGGCGKVCTFGHPCIDGKCL